MHIDLHIQDNPFEATDVYGYQHIDTYVYIFTHKTDLHGIWCINIDLHIQDNPFEATNV